MKRTVVIEEIISQHFEVELDEGKDPYKQIVEMYKNDELVVDQPTLEETKFSILDQEGQLTDIWCEI